MFDENALYPTKTVALTILKRPVTAINQAIYHGRIQHPVTRCGPGYLWCVTEIRQLACVLGELKNFDNYFHDNRESNTDDGAITLG